jgi:hypothetical protein
VPYSEVTVITTPVGEEDAAMTNQSNESNDAVEVLRTVWSADGATSDDLGEAFPTKKSCKNMNDVSFDGMAEPGSDLRQAWRDRLAREGKLSTTGDSIRDLVLGHDAPR